MKQSILRYFLFVTIASGYAYSMELDDALNNDINPRSGLNSPYRDIHSNDINRTLTSKEEIASKIAAIIEEFRDSMRVRAIAQLRIKNSQDGDLGIVIMTEGSYSAIQDDLFFMNARISSLESLLRDKEFGK